MRTAAIAWRVCLLAFLTATSESAVGKTAPSPTNLKAAGKAGAGVHPAESGLTPREIFKRSISDTSGDIFFLTEKYNFMLESGSFKPAGFHASHIATKHDGKVDTVLPAHPDITHGYAWDYDLQIPLAFYDPSGQWFKAGVYSKLAVQQDIAPTLADVLGIAAPDRAEGRVLAEARTQISSNLVKIKRPRLVAVIVQDQMGWQYFDAHPNRLPFLRSLFKRSALFTAAQVAHVDVETAVGHAAIGTGAYTKGHGVSANTRWQTGLWAAQPVYATKLTEDLTSEEFPLQLSAATLADVWLQARQNKPEIFSLCAAARASVSLGGHGSMFKDNKKTAVVYFAEKGKDAGTYTADTNFYRVPESLKDKSVHPYVEALLKEGDGAWFGHSLKHGDHGIDIKLVRATPAMVRFESDLVQAAINEMKLGSHDDTDLLFMNFKSSDYCGHAFGYESEECGSVIDVVDAELAKVVAQLEKATDGQLVVAFTADHGAAPLPELSGGLRYDRGKLQADLNAHFSKSDSQVQAVPYVGASQLWLNQKELARNGHTVADVVTYLRSYEVPMKAPWNMLADDWLTKGKPTSQRFFRDVVSRDELLATPAVKAGAAR